MPEDVTLRYGFHNTERRLRQMCLLLLLIWLTHLFCLGLFEYRYYKAKKELTQWQKKFNKELVQWEKNLEMIFRQIEK